MVRRRLWLSAVLVSCLAVTLVAGCAPANPQGRLAVSGNVTFEGQPLDHGTIQFTPIEGEAGVGTGAMIQNGAYSLEAHQGLPPGKYRVRIFSGEQAGGAVEEMPGMSEEAPKERIPAEYNMESNLEADVSAGNTSFDFNLE